jgi:glycosyltransferase involved in cell wall biosynthesis
MRDRPLVRRGVCETTGQSEMNMDVRKDLWPETRQGRWMSDEFEPGLVSVIVPTYNRAGLLVEAMDSVFQQTYRPIELIVVDDGSTDNTRQVVQKWTGQHGGDDAFQPRYFHQENTGASAARNFGLVESRGQYIQFLDSDDLLHPQKLQSHVTCLSRDMMCDFVYSGSGSFTETVDWGVVPYCGVPVSRERMVSDFLLCSTCLWNTESGLYRRSVCIANGPWDEGLPRFQDWEYNIRLLLIRTNIAYTPGTLTLMRIHGNGRICDDAIGRKKIREFFLGVRTVERKIRTVDSMQKEVIRGLASCYLRYTRLALILGYTDVAREGTELGVHLDLGLYYRTMFLLCQGLVYLPESYGSLATRVILFVEKVIKRLWCLGAEAALVSR